MNGSVIRWLAIGMIGTAWKVSEMKASTHNNFFGHDVLLDSRSVFAGWKGRSLGGMYGNRGG